MRPFSNPGRFQAWFYYCGHRSLLIRGFQVAANSHNIGLMFSGVMYSELPGESMNGLALEEPTPEECAHVGRRLGRAQPVDEGLHVLVTSEGLRYYVYASYLTVEVNNLPSHQHNLP